MFFPMFYRRVFEVVSVTDADQQIFDVIAEKGELWLAKNQDDPRDVVGWIWSKHFAKLADS